MLGLLRGSEEVALADRQTEVQTRQSRQTVGAMLFLAGMIAGILFMAFAMKLNSQTVSVSTSSSPQPLTTSVRGMIAKQAASADRLLAAYRDNEIAADQMYKNQVVLVSGIVDSVGRTSEKGVAYLNFVGKGIYRVQVQFDKTEEATLVPFKKGDRAEVWGYCVGCKDYTVYLVLGLVKKTS